MDYHDSLTSLLSHTSFQLALQQQIEVARRENRSISVAMLDLDCFRSFNETKGFLEGDKLLVWLAECLKSELSDGEAAGRFGGDEFALLLKSESLTGSVQRVERLRRLVEHDSRPVTVSIGLASFPRDGPHTMELWNALDDALYSAKRGGRNRVCASRSLQERQVKPIIGDGDDTGTLD